MVLVSMSTKNNEQRRNYQKWREKVKTEDRDEKDDTMCREVVFLLVLGLENMKISVCILVVEFPFLGRSCWFSPSLSLSLPL